MSVSATSAVPAPFSVSPSWSWGGDDGSWSTFEIAVGTPPQYFHVLPSTTGSETWIPIPDGCAGVMVNIQDCGLLRGVQNVDGDASRGFDTGASSTWDLIGIYELATEQNLWGPAGNPGQYGLDTVTLGSTSPGKDVKLSKQTVAGVATANVWLGSLGLGTDTSSFDVEATGTLSLMDSMQSQNYTPSTSFGYTAGASYTSPQDYGSLLFGGYDQARFKPSNLNFSTAGTNHTTLPLSIASIVAENAIGGTLSLLPGGTAITTIIDSTVSQLWLPQNVCDLFAQAFGLTFDTYTGLYLVNRTTHNQLKQLNPTITFTVGSTEDSSSTTNIELPYSAFDLKGGIPLFNSSTNYFPLRVAANESQQVLGRAFLQEAYIFVDWEREYFTIGQTIHQNSTSNIVPVLSVAYESHNDGQSNALSTAVIAGIAVAAGVAVVLLVALVAFLIFRRRRATKVAGGDDANELHSEPLKPPEIMSANVYELQDGENSRHELYAASKNVSELQADSLERELEGDGERLGKYGWDKKPTTYYEMP